MRNYAPVEHCVAVAFILHREIILTLEACLTLRVSLVQIHEYCAMKKKADIPDTGFVLSDAFIFSARFRHKKFIGILSTYFSQCGKPTILQEAGKTTSCTSQEAGFNPLLSSILARENWRGIRVSVS